MSDHNVIFGELEPRNVDRIVRGLARSRDEIGSVTNPNRDTDEAIAIDNLLDCIKIWRETEAQITSKPLEEMLRQDSEDRNAEIMVPGPNWLRVIKEAVEDRGGELYIFPNFFPQIQPDMNIYGVRPRDLGRA